MTTKLFRYDADGRYQGFVMVDRPIEEYASRIGVDLDTQQPPDAPVGFFAQRQQDGRWVLKPQAAQPPIDLPTAKAQQWAQMKVARRAALQAPLVTPYGTFDADPESRDNIVQTAHLMQTEAQTLAPDQVPSVDFTRADNTAVNLTAGQMVDVALLLAAQIQQAYSRGRQVRAAIDAATTTAQVAAITWSSIP
jgi:hypothetical protein